jgi:hypothetical protein
MVFASQTDTTPTAKKTAVAKKKTTKTVASAKPPAPVSQPLVIPKDAVANADGSFAYTDKTGKKWIYNKTPFGVSRMQDMGVASTSGTESKADLVKSVDSGDTVKFERQSPFGTTKWEKKKADLTDEERSIFQQQHPQPIPAPAQQPE